MRWTEETIARCTELWTPGKLTSREISTQLSTELGVEVTFSAVIARMNQCGLSFSGPATNSPRVPGSSSKRRTEMTAAQLDDLRAHERERDRRNRAERRERAGLPPLPAKTARTPVAAKPPKPAAALPVAGLPPSLRIPLLHAREGQCRYIASDPLIEAPATCCGHKTILGGSWCPAHRAICTTPTRPNVSFPRTWSRS